MVLANLGAFTTSAVYVLSFVGRLGVSPSMVGMIFAAGSVASLGGAQLAKPAIDRFGLGWALVIASLLLGAGRMGIAVAGFSPTTWSRCSSSRR